MKGKIRRSENIDENIDAIFLESLSICNRPAGEARDPDAGEVDAIDAAEIDIQDPVAVADKIARAASRRANRSRRRASIAVRWTRRRQNQRARRGVGEVGRRRF